MKQTSLFESPWVLVAPVPEFYNTIGLSGADLAEAKDKIHIQDRRILALFIVHGPKLTPFEVQDIYEPLYGRVPITSLRRSMTVLTKRGKLEKTSEFKKEREGKVNHYWRLV